MTALCALGLGLVLSSCAPDLGPHLWQYARGPFQPAEVLARDEYECHRDAQAARSGVAMPASAVQLYEKCMAARGYVRR